MISYQDRMIDAALTKSGNKAQASLKVYISYRPQANRKMVEAIRDWFYLRLGLNNVVADVEIPPFVGSSNYYLWEKISECSIFVPIIGPTWTYHLQEYTRKQEEDRARLELRIALQEKLLIAPVCIDGANPPREIDLFADIRELSKAKFAMLGDDMHFEQSMEALIQAIQTAVDEYQAEQSKFNVEAYFALAEAAYQANDLEGALEKLVYIHEHGTMPPPFRLQVQQRIRRIKYQMQYRLGWPVYDEILKLATLDKNQAQQALQLFMTEFPEVGDPQKLMKKLHPYSLEVQKCLMVLSNPHTSPEGRLELGEHLNRLDDTRLGVGLRENGLPDVDWVKVPEGEFIFNFDRRIMLPTFYISRYPITYRQFQVFVESGAFDEDKWWEGLAEREDKAGVPRWKLDNYPALRVSWYDAVAYCRWLSTQLGYEVRLPVEEEWEKAARGAIGTLYPWGWNYIAGYSNINEAISGISATNLRQAVAVGLFPHAASSYGVHDMIGNVWEWCLNEYDNPSINATSDKQKRALRGGSWTSDRLFAHTVRRRGEPPASRFNDIGFRIVTAALPTLSSL